MNRRDVEGLIQEFSSEIEWREVFHEMLGGQATVYRGHDGVRALMSDLYESFEELYADYTDVRDLDERVLALGRLRGRGRGSGAEIDSPVAALVEFEDGKGIRMRSFLDHSEALVAAGLSE